MQRIQTSSKHAINLLKKPFKRLVKRYIPAQFNNPFGLAVRIVRSKDRAAWFAMILAAVGILLIPLDRLLSIFEQRRYRRAQAPEKPIIIIVGPPRSGTTLVAQVLIRYLPVAYINNLTALFPRAPITANALFGRFIRQYPIEFRAYYGKSRHLSGPNDGLYLWDRWLGSERDKLVTAIPTEQKQQMTAFFGAFEAFSGQVMLSKNNSLNTCADLVAQTLGRVWFLCLHREPLFLAQSLYLARQDILDDVNKAYGIDHTGGQGSGTRSPLEDICQQVRFHEQVSREQQKRVGKERFWMISYEDFCQNPQALVRQVASRILADEQAVSADLDQLKPFAVSSRVKIPATQFAQLEKHLVAQSEVCSDVAF